MCGSGTSTTRGMLGRMAAVGAVTVVCAVVVPAGAASGAGGGELWGTATIEPGREGIVEVAGYPDAGPSLGTGSVLTLTAPKGAEVTGTPLVEGGYRGSVAKDASSGTYTFARTGTAWKGRTFPFVLSVPRGTEPGTRLPGCTLVVQDAHGAVQESGTCEVTVGLPGPTLTRPHSGVPLDPRPEMSGTAHPGARITVQDAEEEEVCTTTAAPDGTWSCTPSTDLRFGPGRLQATATFNGVSTHSEQINITVTSPEPTQSVDLSLTVSR